jgi:hypothetical protein
VSAPVLPERIEADPIVVEVTDKQTGKVFRRNLPVAYLETDNGIILAGETLTGEPSEIALLSATALARLEYVFGKGADTDSCGSK